MNWLSFLPNIFGSVTKPIEAIFGNRAKRDAYAADENAATKAQYAAEFRENRTAWDSFVDGLNRLIRPTLVFGTIAIFTMPLWDIDRFVEIMVAYTGVPEPLWNMMYLVFCFYLTSRGIEKIKMNGVTKKELATVKEMADEVKHLRDQRIEAEKNKQLGEELPWKEDSNSK